VSIASPSAGRAPMLRPPSRAPWFKRPATAALAGVVLAVLLAACASSAPATPGTAAPGAATLAATPTAAPVTPAPATPFVPKPPTATPLASAAAAPAGDGTRAVIETEKGTIVIELFTDSAPVAAQNFANLASGGYYDGTPFHRIIPGFVIQGGDPGGDGTGGPGYAFTDEPFAGDYERGIVAMANGGPNTNGSQFFIVMSDLRGQLPKDYTVFGRVVSGMDVAETIVNGPRGGSKNDQALEPVRIVRATLEKP
jgi:peptidyl-prolyl cis-trans isomerase B (cyclophilin B)